MGFVVLARAGAADLDLFTDFLVDFLAMVALSAVAANLQMGDMEPTSKGSVTTSFGFAPAGLSKSLAAAP